jgi:hypothetical protein
MNGIHGLHFASLVEHLHQPSAHPAISNSNEGFAFMTNEFQKPIVVGFAQHGYLTKLISMKGFYRRQADHIPLRCFAGTSLKPSGPNCPPQK